MKTLSPLWGSIYVLWPVATAPACELATTAVSSPTSRASPQGSAARPVNLPGKGGHIQYSRSAGPSRTRRFLLPGPSLVVKSGIIHMTTLPTPTVALRLRHPVKGVTVSHHHQGSRVEWAFV